MEERRDQVRLPIWARPVPWLGWGLATAVTGVYAVRIGSLTGDVVGKIIFVGVFTLLPTALVATFKLDALAENRVPIRIRLLVLILHGSYSWFAVGWLAEREDANSVLHGTALGIMSLAGTLIFATVICRSPRQHDSPARLAVSHGSRIDD